MTRTSFDRFRSRFYVLAALAATSLQPGCASAPAATTPQQAPANPALALAAVTATTPQRRLQIVFEWNMTDRDARFSGRGTLRIDPGYRARLDMFGPRGDALASAIISDQQMRAYPAMAAGMLPPAAFLWAALGVFRQPDDADLVKATVTGGRTALEYARADTRWEFRVEDGILRSTEWTSTGSRRTVELTGTSKLGMPASASFRDWTEFRELTLKVTDVEEKAAFEPDVWILPGERQ
jgi:hypothetical protein